MSLDGYASEAKGLAAMFYELLGEDGHRRVMELARDQANTLVDWRVKHLDDVRAFVRAPPSRRLKILAAAQGDARPLLLFAAMQHCEDAAFLLRNAYRLTPGLSYREMACEAGNLALEVRDCEEADWPMPRRGRTDTF